MALTDHFAKTFVRETLRAMSMTLWLRYNVRKFDADAILFREIQCFNVCGTFSVRFSLKSGKICKNSDHTCLFHCITLAGPSDDV